MSLTASLFGNHVFRRSLLCAAGALVFSSFAAAMPAQPLAPVPVAPTVLPAGKADKKFTPAQLAPAVISVMVELEDQPAINIYTEARNQRHLSVEAAREASEAHAASLAGKQRGLRRVLRAGDIGATVVYSVRHAYNGIAVMVRSENIPRIRALPGVKDVHVLKPRKLLANNSAFFIHTPSFWNSVATAGLGLHGEGIKVGVIDSGIDYIHTDFGGSGSAADYQTNLSLTTTAPNPFFPNAIVAGGYDFAGDDYTGANTPVPDPNPFDAPSTAGSTIGHGTSCAGIIAGRAVTGGGLTYTGPYDDTTPISTHLVGPGMAPGAQIYSYRVFGNTGSTNLVTQAVDRAIQEKMDVISLSLGADSGSGDDTDAAALDNASAAGVICVAAAGNAGDSYYITGSPAASVRDISVAASYNDNYFIATVSGVAPPAIAGQTFVYSPGAGPTINTSIPAQDVVYALPHVGKAFDSTKDADFPDLDNKDAIKGHICLIDRGAISFYIKVAEAQKAGATAVIIANNQVGSVNPGTSGPGPGGTTYVPNIPNGAISQADGTTIKATLDAINGTDTGTQVAFNAINGHDTVPSYTSRGPRRPDGLLKPDVTAPAEAVDAANHNTGTGADAFNGTSSATPHVAGTMALFKQLHPTWTVEQLKALLMNNASHDIYTAPGQSGVKIGPGRVGSGRIDLTPASTATVIAYSADVPGAVSVSFGSLDVPITNTNFTATRTLNVVNKGAKAQAFSTAFTSVGTDVPGVSFSVSPSLVTVPAANGVTDGTATLTVTLTADATQMTHSHDPSIALTQGGNPREWKAEATGYVALTPLGNSGQPLRVTVHAMPRPASTVRATTASLALMAAAGTAGIDFAGTGINTGSNLPGTGGTDILSLLKVMELQFVGTGAFNDNNHFDSANLQYVGLASDYVNEGNDITKTVFNFGLVAYGNHGAPDAFNTEFDILIDTTGGPVFTPNYLVYNFLLGSSATAYLNVYVPGIQSLIPLDPSKPVSPKNPLPPATTGGNTLNGLSSQYDTNIFNTNVLTIPVTGAELEMAGGGNTRIRYQVNAFYNGQIASQTGILTYDPIAPGLIETGTATEPTADADGTGTVTLNYNNANLQANRSLGALAIHFHNADGARADMVGTVTPRITGFSPASGAVGSVVTLTGQGLNDVNTVTFFNNVAATAFTPSADGTSLAVTVPAGASTGTITVTTPSGKFTTTTKFVVTP